MKTIETIEELKKHLEKVSGLPDTYEKILDHEKYDPVGKTTHTQRKLWVTGNTIELVTERWLSYPSFSPLGAKDEQVTLEQAAALLDKAENRGI